MQSAQLYAEDPDRGVPAADRDIAWLRLPSAMSPASTQGAPGDRVTPFYDPNRQDHRREGSPGGPRTAPSRLAGTAVLGVVTNLGLLVRSPIIRNCRGCNRHRVHRATPRCLLPGPTGCGGPRGRGVARPRCPRCGSNGWSRPLRRPQFAPWGRIDGWRLAEKAGKGRFSRRSGGADSHRHSPRGIGC
jgi:hypothetical protein